MGQVRRRANSTPYCLLTVHWGQSTRAVPGSSNAGYGTIRTTARLFASLRVGHWHPPPTGTLNSPEPTIRRRGYSDPTSDVGALSAIDGVMNGGRWTDRVGLDAILAEIERERR